MELNKHTKQYWTEEDINELEKVETFKDMLTVAMRVLNRMQKPIAMVCGPITTGGKGSMFQNMLDFNKAIIRLQTKGVNVFDQMPYEQPMERLKLELPSNEYAYDILTDFYLPIFEAKTISKFYFIPGWESSTGATWEHAQAKRLGIEIEYL